MHFYMEETVIFFSNFVNFYFGTKNFRLHIQILNPEKTWQLFTYLLSKIELTLNLNF
jgi:hypothetical protein